MKAKLLSLTLGLASVMVFGQSNTQKQKELKLNLSMGSSYLPPEQILEFPKVNLQPKVNNANKVNLASYKRLGSSINAFTVQSMYRNCLTYNKDLNAVLFIHRKSEEWTIAGATAVEQGGFIQATWTTNNGASFDSTIVYNDKVNWGRHPSGSIFNPTGNTTIANAKVVVSGLNTVAAGKWVANYFTYGPLTPTAITSTNQFNVPVYSNYTNNGNAISGRFMGAANCAQFTNGAIWSIGGYYKGDVDGTSIATQNITGVEILKAYSTDNGVTIKWKADSIFPNCMTNTMAAWNGKYLGVWESSLIAFGPSGQTGYIVMSGIEAGATGSRRAMQPIVYKTSDAGATWKQVNAGYDWAAGNNPCLMATIKPTQKDKNLKKPMIRGDYGWDATVDNTNKLHLICVAASGAIDHNDSLYVPYDYNFTDYHPTIWDLVTEGDGNWKEYFVDSLYTEELDKTQNENPWKFTGGPKLAYDNRIQVSRTTDGTRIFVGWSDSDPIVTGHKYNSNPDPIFKAINATNMNMSKRINVFEGLQEFHFMMMSDITIDKSSGSYQVPFTYITSNNGYDSEKGVVHRYVDNAIVADAQINIPYSCNSIGIKETMGAIENVSQNFPNPFDATTNITVSLLSAENIHFTVTNTVGQTIINRIIKGNQGENNIVIDASGLSNGIYFYSVNVNGTVVTKKMIVKEY